MTNAVESTSPSLRGSTVIRSSVRVAVERLLGRAIGEPFAQFLLPPRGGGAGGQGCCPTMRVLEYRPMLHLPLSSEREARLHVTALRDPRGHVLTQHGAVFEAMSGAATRQPDVIEGWMPVDQEIAVGGVLVLANASLRQGSALEGGEKAAKILASFLQSLGS